MTRYIMVEANGLEFEVLQAGDGDKLALCLHGFPEHAEMWRHHIDTLVALGYRVWAPNQRGYGNSSKPKDVIAYHIDRLVEDVAALIDASGAKEVTIVAHDWGAVVAWFFAMRAIRPIVRLVVMNVPHPAVYARVLTTSWRQPLRSWYILAFQIPFLPEWLLSRRAGKRVTEIMRETALRPEGFTQEELTAYALQVADRTTARAMIGWYRAAVRSRLFLALRRQDIPIIDVPTLMIWGEDDHALGKETTYGTAAYVRNLKIAYLSGCSHWVSQDAPTRTNHLLTTFLSP